jgi:hypothetical protein
MAGDSWEGRKLMEIAYELHLDLGRDFTPGTTYTVHVNDKTTTFKT